MTTPLFAERVQESSTTSGTGSITLAGANSTYQSFVSGIGDTGQICYYEIVEASSGKWETGHGQLINSTTLGRSAANVIDGSSGPGTLVSFNGGTLTVSLVRPKDLDAKFGEAVASAAVNLLATGLGDDTWYSTDGTNSLPSVTLGKKGTYLLNGYGRAYLTDTNTSGNASIVFSLYDNTQSTLISNSESMAVLNNTGQRLDVNAYVQAIYQSQDDSAVIKLRAKRKNTSGTTTLAGVGSDAYGRTKLSYLRIG